MDLFLFAGRDRDRHARKDSNSNSGKEWRCVSSLQKGRARVSAAVIKGHCTLRNLILAMETELLDGTPDAPETLPHAGILAVEGKNIPWYTQLRRRDCEKGQYKVPIIVSASLGLFGLISAHRHGLDPPMQCRTASRDPGYRDPTGAHLLEVNQFCRPTC